ncbi:MAG TPA: phage major capsid protein [Alphaproteobacteria bacterium]|nr:phage major capsid protein [Alphaproteobacteria bacterium]
MSDLLEIKSATEGLARAFEAFKESNDDRLNSLERKQGDVVLEEKVDRIGADVSRLQEAVSGFKTALRRPAASKDMPVSAAESEHKQAFLRYVHKGYEGELGSLESKAMSVISDPDGGYLVPAELSDRIVTRQFDTTPLRQLATVMTVTSDAVEMLRDTNDADAQWVGELDTRSDTDPGQLGRVRIPVFELHAQPKATQKLLDDANLNVEEWLTNKIAGKFSRKENAAFVNGDGITMPRGFATYSVAATADDSRSWGVFEYVASGASGAFASSNPGDALIDLMHKLRAGYLPKAAWIMPRAVADAVRKFKESTTSAYIWQPGLQAGQPASLLGFPVHLGEDMPALSAGSLSVAFGNFAEGYTIVDRIGLRILRDPFTAAPFVKFRCNKRVGGDVTNFEAIKFLKFSAS